MSQNLCRGSLTEKVAASKESRHDTVNGSINSTISVSSTTSNLIQNHAEEINTQPVGPLTAADPFPTRVPSMPSGKEIVECIGAVKPFDQIQLCKNYVGLRVSWPVRFFSIDHFNDVWIVIFINQDKPRVIVSVSVSIDKYLKLKILDRDHPCWIEGKIQHADWDCIRLENDPTIFLDRDAAPESENA